LDVVITRVVFENKQSVKTEVLEGIRVKNNECVRRRRRGGKIGGEGSFMVAAPAALEGESAACLQDSK
jgi:hypothetical protein